MIYEQSNWMAIADDRVRREQVGKLETINLACPIRYITRDPCGYRIFIVKDNKEGDEKEQNNDPSLAEKKNAYLLSHSIPVSRGIFFWFSFFSSLSDLNLSAAYSERWLPVFFALFLLLRRSCDVFSFLCVCSFRFSYHSLVPGSKTIPSSLRD